MKPISSCSTIANRLQQVRDEIERACIANDRDLQSVSLLAVSKGHGIDAIRQAYLVGQRNFGESYAHEMVQKINEAKELGLEDINWHFIGAIQSNKIKLIAQAQVVQSLGALHHALLLDRECTREMPVYLQVKLQNDPLRQGIFAEKLDEAIMGLDKMKHLNLIGLMTILPLDPTKDAAYWFSIMQNVRNEMAAKYSKPLALSMGMSDDFTQAISFGANVLRIGSRIFGARL
jgi:pyridoxal phosphate enzyme (YggS family)